MEDVDGRAVLNHSCTTRAGGWVRIGGRSNSGRSNGGGGGSRKRRIGRRSNGGSRSDGRDACARKLSQR